MNRLDIPTAGFMSATAPEAIMALRSAGGSGAVRTQEHAAIVTASPLFWFRLLPARSILWETERVSETKWVVDDKWVVASEQEAERVWKAERVARIERSTRARRRSKIEQALSRGPDTEHIHRRLISVRRITGPTRSATPTHTDDLPDETRDALMSLAEDAGLRLYTLLHVADWAWRAYEPARLVVDPPPMPGEPDRSLSWREDGRRRKPRLLDGIADMRLRWAKQAGLIPRYYSALDAVDSQSVVTRRIKRVDGQLPALFRPVPQDATHRRALLAMMRELDRREGLDRLGAETQR